MSDGPRTWVREQTESRLLAQTASIGTHYLCDELARVKALAEIARLPPADNSAVESLARRLVIAMRQNRESAGGLDAFIQQYDLSTKEGVVLMCIAEALLRIPDDDTADRLIADKLGDADFHTHLGASDSVMVNMATWALMLTGKIVSRESIDELNLTALFGAMLNRLGEPVIRAAMRQAMAIMGHQFIIGSTIDNALERSRSDGHRAYLYSFDMLGEAALSSTDATRYLDAYEAAIAAVGSASAAGDGLIRRNGISVKLSALCPRFEVAQARRAERELTERLVHLAECAQKAEVMLTVDAEEADRLLLSLRVLEGALGNSALAGWPGLGLAVQAYQKRALDVVEWLDAKAVDVHHMIPVRLVKGAYWDTEIKLAQLKGLESYPVFTRKPSTDTSFLACAKRLLDAAPRLYPQFATHNANTAAWIMHVGAGKEYEFQRLHGMGEELYAEILAVDKPPPCRVYAPVGSHEDLLPYLVRRLLENGANTSFVNRFMHDNLSVDTLVEDPVAVIDAAGEAIPHPRIPLPAHLHGQARLNSHGLNLDDPETLDALSHSLTASADRKWHAGPIIEGKAVKGAVGESIDPARRGRSVGIVQMADAKLGSRALEVARACSQSWSAVPVARRAELLRAAAGLYEAHRAELAMLCVSEGGRTLPDSLAEIREAVDFLRYYAAESERLFAEPAVLTGPTGESNELRYAARGVFMCISPWNFPLAIFTGQVAAALAAGNTVIAKPAEQTCLIAHRAVELMLDAGLPGGAIQFLPGNGHELGESLLPDERIAGVAFTGSLPTAQSINRILAARSGAIPCFIAETGGVNAMIVDSSALPEQVVRDVLRSAFNSAGQRCSALRLLCLQDDVADEILAMLRGALAELVIGDPASIETDIGPVIDAEACQRLQDYRRANANRTLMSLDLPDDRPDGFFVEPTVLELDTASALREEIFGPILHVVRYRSSKIDELVDTINDIGFGLTLGIHSRINSFAHRIARRARVGNVYVNRDMIGAVVGVQPFGGLGLSGTGPKAGGPNYLLRFATEQSVSTNTAAVGGNASLLSLGRLEASGIS